MTERNSLTRYSLSRQLHPLLATQSRRRMAVVAASTLLFSLFSVGVETIFPLWVTESLGFTAEQWAQMRSLRFAGVMVGVILLGALSDRFGQRLLGAVSMLGAAAALLIFRSGSPLLLWVLFPLYGALISTAFVNLNTLTQLISQQRQGLANSIYRAIGAGVGMVAPILATQLDRWWHGYSPVFAAFAALLVIAGVVLFCYPGEEAPAALGKPREELARLLAGYRTAFAQRPLMAFINLSLIWGNLLAGVGTFIAIRFTLEMRQSNLAFGYLSALAGAAGFLATVIFSIVLDRLSLRRLHGVVGLLAGACSLAMGLGNSVLFTAAGFVLFAAFTTLLLGPSSMWVSRAAGEGTQTAAFSVYKILAALYVAVVMALLGALERWIGIRLIFLYAGLFGGLSALGFFLLPDPPRPGNPKLSSLRE